VSPHSRLEVVSLRPLVVFGLIAGRSGPPPFTR